MNLALWQRTSLSLPLTDSNYPQLFECGIPCLPFEQKGRVLLPIDLKQLLLCFEA